MWYAVEKAVWEEHTMTDIQQRGAAAKFAENWNGRGYEKGESQTFCAMYSLRL